MHKLAAVSVDLDEIGCYAAIHGLTELALQEHPEALTAIYDHALVRLERLFAELAIPATFFVIGRDLARAENGARLRRLHAQGHELANHSLNHRYDLSRQSPEVMRREIGGGADAIEQACGTRPVGFRAPGYTTNDALFRALADCGVQYDSSVFPCPAYYAAKTAAIGWIRMRGRRSHSVVDHPRVLRAPADPYRVAASYVERGAGMLEFPIGVTSDLSGRLPYIGTSVVLGGERSATTLSRLAGARAFVNLELHGIDLADARADGLAWLAPHQPDLRRSAEHKERSLRAAVAELRRQGFSFVTLAQACLHV